jgi:hypothetical protein
MSDIVVTVNDFRTAFPEFTDVLYTDGVIGRYITMAEAYISTKNFRIKPATRKLLIELMTGHLLTLAKIDPTTQVATGSASPAGFETSATVGGVSVTLQAQMANNLFEQWINSTSYGQQYWAILTATNPTGVHYVGIPNAFGIR